MNKVLALKYALRCFTCGLLSFIPVVGMPFALAAIMFLNKSSGQAPEDWHVARRYTTLGMIFAALGLLLNVTALVLLGAMLAEKNL